LTIRAKAHKRLGMKFGVILKSPFIVRCRQSIMAQFEKIESEVIELEKKTKILIVSTLLVLAAVLSVVAMYAYAASDNATATSTNIAFYYNGTALGSRPFFGHGCRGWGGFGVFGGFGGFGGSLNVSQAFKDRVISIAENNTNVQNLIANGYNVTGVTPIITATVGANGTVTFVATNAIVTLAQHTTGQNTTSMGRALVWVNVEQAKVTKIVTTTRTVIENP
jgi:hypothetical protein